MGLPTESPAGFVTLDCCCQGCCDEAPSPATINWDGIGPPDYTLPTVLGLLQDTDSLQYWSTDLIGGNLVQMSCGAGTPPGYYLAVFLNSVPGWDPTPIIAFSVSCSPYEIVFKYAAAHGVPAFTVRVTE